MLDKNLVTCICTDAITFNVQLNLKNVEYVGFSTLRPSLREDACAEMRTRNNYITVKSLETSTPNQTMEGLAENFSNNSVLGLTNLTSSDFSPSHYMVIEGSVVGALIGLAAIVYFLFLSSICLCHKLNGDESCASQYSTGLYFVYKMFFPQFVEVGVTEDGAKGKGKNKMKFLFGGYKEPRKPLMVHVYFMTMMFLAICWFFVMFVDTAIYRKTTTCNDINVQKNAYVCFDVNADNYHRAEPVDCAKVIDDLDVHVLCYLRYFNFPTAASIAFSFMQLIVFGIYVTFAITLYFVAKWKNGKFISIIIWVVSAVIMVAVIISVVVALDQEDSTQDTGLNFLYGDRVPRYIICGLGCLTVLLLSALSPYCWLIEHDPEKLYLTFDSGV